MCGKMANYLVRCMVTDEEEEEEGFSLHQRQPPTILLDRVCKPKDCHLVEKLRRMKRLRCWACAHSITCAFSITCAHSITCAYSITCAHSVTYHYLHCHTVTGGGCWSQAKALYQKRADDSVDRVFENFR